MPKTSKAVTRVDLYEAVYQKVGLSRTESSAFVELVLKEITDCLEKGETVKLSSFGSFMVRYKGRRLGRNPKTGIEVPISPRRVVVFKPSAIMKQQINSQPPGCAYRKSHPAILMMQSAQDRAADDIPGPFNAARYRRVLVQ
jgi:integration host factor subunit alpha